MKRFPRFVLVLGAAALVPALTLAAEPDKAKDGKKDDKAGGPSQFRGPFGGGFRGGPWADRGRDFRRGPWGAFRGGRGWGRGGPWGQLEGRGWGPRGGFAGRGREGFRPGPFGGPGFLAGRLKLSDEQKKKVAALWRKTHEEFLSILTPEQKKELRSFERGPRGGELRATPGPRPEANQGPPRGPAARPQGPPRGPAARPQGPPRGPAAGPRGPRGPQPRPKDNRDELEKRLDKLMQELEALRREIRR